MAWYNNFDTTTGGFPFHVDGRIGITVNQPYGSGTDYPLVTPSDDIRYLLADAYLVYDDPYDYGEAASQFELPFRIDYLYGIGDQASSPPGWAPAPTHAADVVIRDANDDVVFDSTTGSYATRTWADRLAIHEWKTTTAQFRLVVHTHWRDDEDGPEPRNYDEHIAPTDGTLDIRTILRLPKRVRTIKAVLTTASEEPLEFIGGYNVVLEHAGVLAVDGTRRTQQIVFSATAGSGEGQFPACTEPEGYIRTVNGVGPDDNGNLQISATDCYYVRQPTSLVGDEVSPTPYTLQLGNDCDACCSCDDYVDVALRMRAVRNQYAELGSDAEAARNLHGRNVQRWLAAKACREDNKLQVVLQSNACPYVDVAVGFCNTGEECASGVAVNIAFTTSPPFGPGDTLPTLDCRFTRVRNNTPGSLTLPASVGGAWPNYNVLWDSVNPGQAATARFRLEFPDNGITYAVQATVTGSVMSPAELLPAKQAFVTLACPDSCE